MISPYSRPEKKIKVSLGRKSWQLQQNQMKNK